ncbi:MAG: hypothetical protein KZQ77_02840, partial [Candidatus Thiodiazotropha sp. (ex Notomyrtea botanica)]|nr:hypothetical protein [Candidatus Thiodiazotropha sp. (ex Notomyrtea botanica)]
SMRKHAPQVCVCLAIADKIGDYREELEKDFDLVIGVEELGDLNDPAWCFRHSIVEFATAIKPFVLQKLLGREDCEAVFYFDPDTALFSSMDGMIRDLGDSNIMLTPHLTDPETSQRGIEDNELSALKHGVYNLGYVGVRNTSEGKRFSAWWASRLKDYCRDDIPAGIFTDQRWCDLVPAFFNKVKVSRYPGYNVAPWNMTNRKVEKLKNGSYTVNGKPLVFYHFTGFDSGAHHVMLSLYSKDSPAAAELFKWYKSELDLISGDAMSSTKWAYMTFDDGELITKQQREVYGLREDLKRAFPNPFETDNKDEMLTYKQWWSDTGVNEFGQDGESSLNGSTLEEGNSISASVIPSKGESGISLIWLVIASREHRSRAYNLIKSTFHMWGLKGVVGLVIQRVISRE